MRVPGWQTTKKVFGAAVSYLPPVKKARAKAKVNQRKEFLKDRNGLHHLQYALENQGRAKIGRSQSRDNNIGDGNDLKMSNSHADIDYDGTRTRIRDLKSTHGTTVKFYPQKGESFEITAKVSHSLGYSLPLIIDGHHGNEEFYLAQDIGLENALARSPIGTTLTIVCNAKNPVLSIVNDGEKIPKDEMPILEVNKRLKSRIDPDTPGYVFTSVFDGNLAIEIPLGKKRSSDENKTRYAPVAVTDIKDMDITTGEMTQSISFGTRHPNSTDEAPYAVQVDATDRVGLLNLIRRKRS